VSPADTVKHLQVGRILALSFAALPGVECMGRSPASLLPRTPGTRVFDVEVTLPKPA